MRKIKVAWMAAWALGSAGSLVAHHALTNFDTTTPVRVKGKIVKLYEVNPHSILYIEGTGPDGQPRRWAVEGPAILQLQRRGFQTSVFRPGDTVEACGYLPKEPIVWQIANADKGDTSMNGRLLNGETLTLAHGKQQSWGDYGVHLCFGAGFTDQHTK